MSDELDKSSSELLERKLATILSADVAEFSRLMGEDEEETLRVFRGHKQVFESLVAMHRGRVFNGRRCDSGRVFQRRRSGALCHRDPSRPAYAQ